MPERHALLRPVPLLLLATSLLAAPPALSAQGAGASSSPPSIADKTRGMEKRDGLFPLYWDSATGRVFLEIPHLDRQYLYVEALPWGMGSNDIGLDRGQEGQEKLVEFHRSGPKILMVQPNLDYRAETENAAERRAIEQSFARSVIWGFKVAAETDGRVLVDATDFAVRDVHDVVGALKRSNQGAYHLDRDRSAIYLPDTRAFPRNTVIEATLTYEGDAPGRWVRDVTPTPTAITLRERVELVELPGPGFHEVRNTPGAGYFGITYDNYAAPLGHPMTERFITKHRLEKKDPAAAVSEPVQPIVYYLDPGVPEPIRSALLRGVGWWNQAFEAAGFRNAFRVEMLPDSADPLDIRYNVVEWVHRATRGWSYGGSIVDPRTGEIIQGHVTLGSLRARQDYLIGRGLIGPYHGDDADTARIARMVLARMSQLGAHETGHTLGLAHNYIASTEGRASVMDYPYMDVKLAPDGSLDLSDAYASGIGAWDKVTIAYGYSVFPPGVNDDSARMAILADARAHGITFLTDQDARPTGSVHPRVHLWDNGTDAAAELERLIRVRAAALDRFGETSIRQGMPVATMEEALVPIYLFHRYQVEAAAKVVGGESYDYALRGDGQTPMRRVPGPEQHQALAALMHTLSPAVLALPRSIVDRLPPRPFLYPAHRELFERYTGLAFDPVAPARVAADLTVSMLLQPQRAARLVEQHALDASLPGLAQVLDTLVQATFGARTRPGYDGAVQRTVRDVVLHDLLSLGAGAPMPDVRAQVLYRVQALRRRLAAAAPGAPEQDRAQAALMVNEIDRFVKDPTPFAKPAAALEIPPGSPIGQAMLDYLREYAGW